MPVRASPLRLNFVLFLLPFYIPVPFPSSYCLFSCPFLHPFFAFQELNYSSHQILLGLVDTSRALYETYVLLVQSGSNHAFPWTPTAMASNLEAMASTLLAMASNLIAGHCNCKAFACSSSRLTQ